MKDSTEAYRRDLKRYRFLLQFNSDQRAREALLEMIAETEERLRAAEADATTAKPHQASPEVASSP